MDMTNPITSSCVYEQFSENKNKFHRNYTVRISFINPYYSYVQTNDLIREWIIHHKGAFNKVWLQPEFCPSSRRVHYHGVVDVKDQFRLNKMLRLFKQVGSFHLEAIKSTWTEYFNYCLKEVPQTECMEYQYNNFISASEARALKQDNTN